MNHKKGVKNVLVAGGAGFVGSNLIRRLLESFGHKVERLRRIQIGGLRIRGMPVGAIKELNEKEINLLFDHSEKPSTNYS